MKRGKLTILDCISFLRSPFIPPQKKIRIQSFFYLFAVVQLLTLPFAFIDRIPFIINFFEIKQNIHLEDFKESKVFFFFSVVLLGPPIEEFISRYYINRLAYIVGLMLSLVGVLFILLTHYTNTFFWITYALIGFWVTINATKNILIKTALNNFQRKHFKSIFYLSAILFGMLHILNYPIFGYKSLLAIGLVIPQIIGGLQLGYLRLRYGINVAIVAHILNNLIGFLIYLILNT